MQQGRQQQEPAEATRERFNAAPERRRNLRPLGRGGCQGNGRITRLAGSNILGREGKIRIMIPIFREDYILAMQAFSGGNPIPVIRMFRRAAEISSSVPFELEFSDLTGWLREREAFSSPSEGK